MELYIGLQGRVQVVDDHAVDGLELVARGAAPSGRRIDSASSKLRAFAELSVRYQAAVDEPEPLYRRRAQ